MNKYSIDFDKKKIVLESKYEISLHSEEGYECIRKLWEYTNWANKYSYNFTWLGRPIIQLPDDMIRIQEIIFRVKPTIIIETGVAHGGSLIYYASLLKMMGEGSVIGIDIDIRSPNKSAIENHPLSRSITLIEGSSIDTSVIDLVKERIPENSVVMVILDSCHSKEHVLAELELYSSFVTLGSYILVADGIMKDVVDAPNAQEDWVFNNPQEAIHEFLVTNKKFKIENWNPIFCESNLHSAPSYYENGFLKRVSQ